MHDNDRLDVREYWDLLSADRRWTRILLVTSLAVTRWDEARLESLFDVLTNRRNTDGLYVDHMDAEQLTEWAGLLRGPWPSAAAHLEALAESRQALDDTRRDDADRGDQWR